MQKTRGVSAGAGTSLGGAGGCEAFVGFEEDEACGSDPVISGLGGVVLGGGVDGFGGDLGCGCGTGLFSWGAVCTLFPFFLNCLRIS